MNTEKTEPTRTVERSLNAAQDERQNTTIEKAGAEGVAFSAGDYVRTSKSAMIEGICQITGYADDDYDYPDYLNFYIGYFDEDLGTCTVHVSEVVEKVTQKEYDAAMVEYAAEAAAIKSQFEATSGIAYFLAQWQEKTDAIDAPWREDERYRQYNEGALFYKGGEQGQYMRVSNNGTITVGRYDLAKPGIEDAVLSADTSHHLPNYDQALMLAARLCGERFVPDLFCEAERLAAQVAERRQAVPALVIVPATEPVAESAHIAYKPQKATAERTDGYTSVKAAIENGKKAPKSPHKVKAPGRRRAKNNEEI